MRLFCMKSLSGIILICLGILWPETTRSQTPTFTINPEGSMSVCAGTNVSLSANLSNAFAGTTSYAVGDVPFSPYAIPGGISLQMNDDTIIGPLPIGFQFCFFGNTYTQFYLGSNGWIGFSPGQTRSFVAMSVPYALPSPPNPGVPRNCIMGPWMDFNPQIAGGPYIRYQTQGTAPYRRLVVQWTNCPLYLCTALRATLQIVIFESTNIIENYITNKPTCNAWAGGTATQALHNQMGTVAVAVPGRNASVWTATNDGKRYTPNGPPGFTINWTANGFPIGTGNSASYTVNAFTRLIGRATFQCSNLILYDTLDVSIGGSASAAFSVNGSSAASPPSVCAGQPVTLSYTGGAAGAAAWSLPGGTPASGSGYPGQTVTYNTPGTYTAGLTITPSSGACSPGSSSKTITVIAAPAATMSLPATTCINSAINVSYIGIPVAGATYSWNFGSGASPATASGIGPHSVQWATSGSKTIGLTVTSGSCSASGSGIIAVTAAPAASFTINPGSVCTGANAVITFNGVAPAGTTYSWNFGSGASSATSTSAGPFSINWSTSGNKTISLTVSSGGCSATSSQNLTVNALPSANFTLPASVCAGANATATYTGGAGIPPAATYTWNLGGGSPAAGNVQGPLSINWASAGAKTVSLTVTQNGCTSAPATRNINVTALPVVNIAATPATQCVNQSVSLAISGSPPPAGSTYQWTFPGASPATSTSSGPVNVSWSTAGTQNASLVITSNGCSSLPATTNITVTNPASATLSIPATACVGAPVALSASGTFAAGTVFNWNFNGGTVLSGSGQGPYSISWGSAGAKTISLTTSLGSCSSTTSGSISIQTAPVINISGPAAICENQSATISFTGSAAPGASYNWNFGTGASPATANTAGPHAVTWSGSGSKTVSLSVSAGGCTSSGTQNFSVSPALSPAISLPASICAGNSANVSYSGTLVAGATYSWNFGAGASPATTSGVGPHAVNWSAAGSPVINLSVSASGCTYSSSATATVNALPSAAFSPPSTLCAGTGAAISASAATGTTYNWNFGLGASPATSGGAGPHAVSWATAGVKSITLTAVRNGCSSSNTVAATVNAPPVASFSMPATACSGSQVNIQYTGSSPAGSSFNWNFGAGASPVSATGIGPHQVSFPVGNRNISLTVSENGCSSAPVSQSINVIASPTATFSLNSPVCINNPATAIYSGTAGAGATFSWSYPGGTLVGGSGSGPLQISWASGGLKTVSLVVSENGCTSASGTDQVTVNAPAVFSISSPAYAGTGVPATISYSGTQPAGAIYTWNFDGGTVISGSGAGPYLVNWASTGIKNIQCTVTVAGCSPTTNSSTTEVVSGAVVAFSAQSPVCGNQISNVQFTGVTFGSASYQWDFDGGSIISGSGPGPFQISWPAPGTKTIRLRVTDLGITSAEVAVQVNVYAIPTANFSIPSDLCSGRDIAVNYSGNGGAGASFQWNFGTGSVSGSAGRNNLVTFPTGNTSVSLTVSENGCISLPNSIPLNIKPTPTASFTTTGIVCEGEENQLVYTGNGGITATYSWTYPGAVHVSGSSPDPLTIRWTQAGNHIVELQASLDGCTSDLFSVPVTVRAKPTANFSILSGNCTGDTVVLAFTGNAAGSAVYTWSYPGATLITGNGRGPLKLVYQSPGTYSISLEVNDAGCSSGIFAQNLTQHEPYQPAFSLSDTIYVSQTAIAVYNGSAPSSVGFSWRYPGGALQNGTGPGPLELSWNQSGTQQVFLQLSNQGCVSPEISRDVVVLPIPSSQFFVSNDSICTGTMIWANYGGPVVGAAEYHWDFDGATILSGSGAGPYQLEWPYAGLKNIRLEVKINGQGSALWQETVRVIEMPRAPFSLPASVCAGSLVHPSFTGTESSSNQFSWSYDGGTANGANSGTPTFVWDSPGVKTVTLSVADAMCISSLESRTIIVHAVPSANFTAPPYACAGEDAEIFYTGNAGSSAAYSWNLQDAAGEPPIATDTFRVKWSVPGVRSLDLRVTENGCASAVFSHQLDVKARPVVYAGTDQLLCSGDTIELEAAGDAGLKYKWFPNGGLSVDSVSNPELSLRAVHSYVDTLAFRVEAHDGFCMASDTVLITLAPMPEAMFIVPDPQCFEGNAFDFKADGAFTDDASFNWSFGAHAYSHTPYEQNQNNIHFETSGKHPVSLTISQYGCSSNTYTREITVYGHPAAAFSLSPEKGCIPLTSRFEAKNGLSGNTYTWNFGDGQMGSGQTASHTYYVSGYMSVELMVSDSNGCKSISKQEEAVMVLERPIAGFKVNPDLVFLGSELELMNLSHNAKFSYYIIGGDTILGATSAYTFTEPGTHVITQVVINAQGCEDEISHQVIVEHGRALYIPSAFSPNNDGTNDLFRIEGSALFQYHLIVFDRWGTEVFSSRNVNEGWSGYGPNGEPLPEGVYGFILEARDQENQDIRESGQVTLIR
jgi:gliding motility-associated-like protein